MIKSLTFVFSLFVSYSLFSQTKLQVLRDSIQVRNGELIIQNATRNISGFLYNIGNGITEFRPIENYAVTGLTGDIVASGSGIISTDIQPNVITNIKMAQMVGLSVKANPLNTTASAQDLQATGDYTVLNRQGSSLVFTKLKADHLNSTYSGGQVLQTDASGNMNWITIGSVTGLTGSGNASQVAYWSGPGILSGSANYMWDNTNSRLGLFTNSPTHPLTFGSGASSGIRMYNTTDQITNSEYGYFGWNSNVLTLGTGKAGTGISRIMQVQSYADLQLYCYSAGSAVMLKGSGGTGAATTFNLGGGNNNGYQFTSALAVNGTNESITQHTVNMGGSGGTKDAWLLNGTWNNGTTATNINGVRISPLLPTTGSGTQYIFNVGTNTANTGAIGTHTKVFTIDNTGIIRTTLVDGASGNTATPSIYFQDGGTGARTGIGKALTRMYFFVPTSYGYFNFIAGGDMSTSATPLLQISPAGINANVPLALGSYLTTQDGTGSNLNALRTSVYLVNRGGAGDIAIGKLNGAMQFSSYDNFGNSSIGFQFHGDGLITSTPSSYSLWLTKDYAMFGGTSSPSLSIRFQVNSVTSASQPFPRMTQAQRMAISIPSPASAFYGAHVYQTDGTEGVYVYKSTGWQFAY